MKKIFVALLAFVIINSFCFTQPPLVKAEEAKTFIGAIESFRPVMGRPSKWYSARFTAVNDIGEKKEIWILGASGVSPTSVTDFDGKPMDKPGYNHRPQVGKKVEVKYSIAENGRNEAILIRYVPADYVQQAVSSSEQSPSGTPTKPSLNSTTQSGITLIGRIDKVLPIPPRFRTNHNCVIHVVPDGDKKYMSFWLKNSDITYFDGKPLAVQDLKKGERIEVKYLSISRTSLDGVNEAMAISVRYVPADYVPKPTASTTEQTVPNSPTHSGNVIVGRINSVWPGVPRSMKIKECKIRVMSEGGSKDAYFETKDASVTDIDGKLLPCDSSSLRDSRVEVTYSEAEGYSAYDPYKPAKAISIRYILENNVSSSASSATAVSEAGNDIFVGKVVKGGVTFSLKCPYRFVIVVDNGEKKDIWIPRDNMRITELNGNSVYGAPPRAGRKMEIKYLIGDNGQYEAASMRYVPDDYVQQSVVPVLSTQIPATTVEQEAKSQGNVFVGKLEKATPVFHHMDKSQPRCKLLVVADNGEQKLFFVSGLCPVIDASGKDISQTWGNIASLLKKGERLEVKYSVIRNGNFITNGQNGADSIRCLD